MLIIAGTLHVDAEARDRYLELTFDVARQARSSPGCLDFVQAADPLDPGRINVFERWETDEDLQRFRDSGPESGVALPDLLRADVARYLVSSVEAP